MSRALEYFITLVIGVAFIFLVIQPVAHAVGESLNKSAACISDVKECQP